MSCFRAGELDNILIIVTGRVRTGAQEVSGDLWAVLHDNAGLGDAGGDLTPLADEDTHEKMLTLLWGRTEAPLT